MSADDDDRGSDPAFEGPVDLKERCRRAIAFLQRARDLPDLSPAQIDRIERRLQEQPARPARRLLLSPALAALIVLLLAGGALAMAGRDLTWLSGIGHWLGARQSQPTAPAPQPGIRTPRAEAPALAAAPAVTSAAAPTPPAPHPKRPSSPRVRSIGPSHTLEPSRAHRARMALAPTRDPRVLGPAAKKPGPREAPQRGACPAGARAAATSSGASGYFPVARGDASHRAGRCGSRTHDTARGSARSGPGRGCEPDRRREPIVRVGAGALAPRPRRRRRAGGAERARAPFPVGPARAGGAALARGDPARERPRERRAGAAGSHGHRGRAARARAAHRARRAPHQARPLRRRQGRPESGARRGHRPIRWPSARGKPSPRAPETFYLRSSLGRS